MAQSLQRDSDSILIENETLEAAKCKECGAKIYPRSLLETHLMRHERRHRWFMTELKKLRFTMVRMRDIA